MESLPVRLGLATEWIEMANGCCYIDSCLCLGLATEWIEILGLISNLIIG